MSRNQAALWVMKSVGGDPEPLIPGDYMMHQWSPDGRGLAASDGDDIYLIAPDDPVMPGFEATRALAALFALALRPKE
jgi:TolB protein